MPKTGTPLKAILGVGHGTRQLNTTHAFVILKLEQIMTYKEGMYELPAHPSGTRRRLGRQVARTAVTSNVERWALRCSPRCSESSEKTAKFFPGVAWSRIPLTLTRGHLRHGMGSNTRKNVSSRDKNAIVCCIRVEWAAGGVRAAICALAIIACISSVAIMSFGRPPNYSTFTVTPPDRGSFPLDHEGECKTVVAQYIKCMRDNKMDNGACRYLSKQYLQCRMDKGLMEKDDMSNLGFHDDDSAPPSANATTSSAKPPASSSTAKARIV